MRTYPSRRSERKKKFNSVGRDAPRLNKQVPGKLLIRHGLLGNAIRWRVLVRYVVSRLDEGVGEPGSQDELCQESKNIEIWNL
jgi:hypothetical protein